MVRVWILAPSCLNSGTVFLSNCMTLEKGIPLLWKEERREGQHEKREGGNRANIQSFCED